MYRRCNFYLPPLWGKVARTKCATEGGLRVAPFRLAALGTFPHADAGGRLFMD